jgi:hypothetical protein
MCHCLKSSYLLESLSHNHFNTGPNFVAHARKFLPMALLAEAIDLQEEIRLARSKDC